MLLDKKQGILLGCDKEGNDLEEKNLNGLLLEREKLIRDSEMIKNKEKGRLQNKIFRGSPRGTTSFNSK